MPAALPDRQAIRTQPARDASREGRRAQKALELSSVPGKATDLEKMYIAAIAARRDEKAKDQDEAFVQGAARPGGEVSERGGSADAISR